MIVEAVPPTELCSRYQSIFATKPKQVGAALSRRSNAQLQRLVAICPEITNRHIDDLFEEYRYGAVPTFSVFLVDDSMSLASIVQ